LREDAWKGKSIKNKQRETQHRWKAEWGGTNHPRKRSKKTKKKALKRGKAGSGPVQGRGPSHTKHAHADVTMKSGTRSRPEVE